jgi:hypothetical protein
MIVATLFLAFGLLLVLGVPVGVCLGLAGAFAIWLADQSIMAMPTNVYAGIAKYPLIAIPMFVLVGCVFERTGVALRLVRFASAVVGAGRGALASVAVLVAMVLGGITGSGPANSAAVGQVMTKSMAEDGYPRPFIASTVGAAAATDILIPPSIAFIVYAVLVPGVSVPAIFAAGMIPGILAGLFIIAAVVLISIVKDFGGKARTREVLAVWQTFKEAIWGLMAPVVILGGMRIGLVTPTEAAVMAVFYGLFVGFVIYRSLTLRDVYEMLVERGVGGRPRARFGGHARPAHARPDRGRHVPRRHLDLPDPAAGPAADRRRLPVGHDLVRRGADDDDRHRPVHPAHGGEPHGLLPDRGRADGDHHPLGDVAGAGHGRRGRRGHGLPRPRPRPAARDGPDVAPGRAARSGAEVQPCGCGTMRI